MFELFGQFLTSLILGATWVYRLSSFEAVIMPIHHQYQTPTSNMCGHEGKTPLVVQIHSTLQELNMVGLWGTSSSVIPFEA